MKPGAGFGDECKEQTQPTIVIEPVVLRGSHADAERNLVPVFEQALLALADFFAVDLRGSQSLRCVGPHEHAQKCHCWTYLGW